MCRREDYPPYDGSRGPLPADEYRDPGAHSTRCYGSAGCVCSVNAVPAVSARYDADLEFADVEPRHLPGDDREGFYE